MDAKKEGGLRLKKARKAVGWTLQELSRKTGGVLSVSRIGNFEQGTRRMTPQVATLLGNILGVPPVHLLCMEAHEAQGDEELTPEETRMLKAYRALDEKDRERELIHLEVMALPHRRPATDRQIKAYADPAKRPKSKTST